MTRTPCFFDVVDVDQPEGFDRGDDSGDLRLFLQLIGHFLIIGKARQRLAVDDDVARKVRGTIP